MKKLIQCITVTACFILFTACRQKSERDKMLETSMNVLTSIKENSEDKFINLIAVDLNVIGKNKEMLHNDFQKLREYYKTFIGNKQIQTLFIDSLNSMGQKKIKLVFHKGAKNSQPPYDVRLDLYFGPPTLFPLNRLSGYELIGKTQTLIE